MVAQPPQTASHQAEVDRLRGLIASEIVALDKAWLLFESLFMTNAHADALAKMCPRTARVLAITLQRDIGLMIARLFDPPQTRVKGEPRWNASLPAFVHAIEQAEGLPDSRVTALKTHLKSCAQQCGDFTGGRHRLLDHLDYATAVGKEELVLPQLGAMGPAIDAIRTVFDLACDSCGYPDVDWGEFETSHIKLEVEQLIRSVSRESANRADHD